MEKMQPVLDASGGQSTKLTVTVTTATEKLFRMKISSFPLFSLSQSIHSQIRLFGTARKCYNR